MLAFTLKLGEGCLQIHCLPWESNLILVTRILLHLPGPSPVPVPLRQDCLTSQPPIFTRPSCDYLLESVPITLKQLEIVFRPHGAVQDPQRMESKTSDFLQSLRE